MSRVKFEIGLESFLRKEYRKYRKVRLGVLCNQASVDKKLKHISETVLAPSLNLQVTCFFGPQHGVRGEKQDDMKESPDFEDPRSKLPVYSLYGASREPSEAALDKVDAFLIDLQDIGTRIYTFVYTMANCMHAARKLGKKVIVLDRPNPINGTSLEGNVLEKEFSSFVGQYPICARHGMTIGELAHLFNEEFGIHCDLEVIPLRGWKREHFWDDLGREWIPPSPNIPILLSALVFPGCVLFEGTNISEGRGTTRPFELIGAPYIDPDKLALEMNRQKLRGVYFRPVYFQPTFQKWKEEVCGGVQIHVTDRRQINAFEVGVKLLAAIVEHFRDGFAWKNPPYEYEYERMPVDLIAGTQKLREAIDSRKGLSRFLESAREQVSQLQKVRKKYLLY